MIELAEKQTKSNQKKILLKTLKEKQKKLREEEFGGEGNIMGLSKNSFNPHKTTNSRFFFVESNTTSKSFHKTVFSNKTMMNFDRQVSF